LGLLVPERKRPKKRAETVCPACNGKKIRPTTRGPPKNRCFLSSNPKGEKKKNRKSSAGTTGRGGARLKMPANLNLGMGIKKVTHKKDRKDVHMLKISGLSTRTRGTRPTKRMNHESKQFLEGNTSTEGKGSGLSKGGQDHGTGSTLSTRVALQGWKKPALSTRG